MHVNKVTVKNFRLLKDVELAFEKKTTVIVGRNNSGKTSLTEIFKRLLSEDSPKFRLEDFSFPVHESFWNAFQLKEAGEEHNAIREVIPKIEILISISYDVDAVSLGALSNFIIDLNPASTEALVKIRYELEEGKIDTIFDKISELFEAGTSVEEKKKIFFKILQERIPKYFTHTLRAIDPHDLSNERIVEWSKLKSLLQSGFINAQRGLDDTTDKEKKEKNVLGKILESLFNTASSDTAGPQDKLIAETLEVTIGKIQTEIDEDFNDELTKLLPAFTLFGYPGLSDPGLRTETTLNLKGLMSNYTKVRYGGLNGINLPEAYNGLGTRNLIFILLKLLEFFKSFQVNQPALGMHLVFIEEPEAHLHPQMQNVFMRQIEKIADVFSRDFNNGVPWPVQFIVSTHSSHMANESSFSAIRYFLASANAGANRYTRIKDLRQGLIGQMDEEERNFLHQYLTLTSCDLFFADKAILIEGASERIMLPTILAEIDKDQEEDEKLSSQYFSVLEVGGAYAHRFFGLLDFLELKTLIITDLDSVKLVSTKWKSCKVSESTRTSNGCIKNWFNDNHISPADLLLKVDNDKISGIRRLCYQIPQPDSDVCGRSFEAAFILANPILFNLSGVTAVEKEDEAWEIAGEAKKTEFALKYAISETEWFVPEYMLTGLRWLARGVV